MQVLGRPDLAPGSHGDPGRLEEPALRDPVLGHVQRQPTGTDGPDRVDRVDDIGRDVFELIRHDIAPPGQAERPTDIVIARNDDPIGDADRGTVRIRIEDGDPVAHRPGRHADHPPELATAEDADRGRRHDGRPLDADAAMDLGDPRLLAVRVLVRLDRAVGHDAGLELRITLDEGGIGKQRVAERHVALELLGVGQDVAMDAELRAATNEGAHQHRPARWPWIGTWLRSEPQLPEHRRDSRDVLGSGRDGEIHDALAGQSGDGRAADVLDHQVRTALADELGDGARDLDRPRIPRLDRRGQSDVRPDRRVHRGSVDCAPMRHVIGRHALEVDVG